MLLFFLMVFLCMVIQNVAQLQEKMDDSFRINCIVCTNYYLSKHWNCLPWRIVNVQQSDALHYFKHVETWPSHPYVLLSLQIQSLFAVTIKSAIHNFHVSLQSEMSVETDQNKVKKNK